MNEWHFCNDKWHGKNYKDHNDVSKNRKELRFFNDASHLNLEFFSLAINFELIKNKNRNKVAYVIEKKSGQLQIVKKCEK